MQTCYFTVLRPGLSGHNVEHSTLEHTLTVYEHHMNYLGNMQ